MIEFFEWACDPDRPLWVIAIVIFFLLILVALAFILVVWVLILTMWVIDAGYWIVPVVIFILLPLCVLVKAYLKDTQAK